MKFIINRNSEIPISEQLCSQIKRQLYSDFKPGDKLPPVNQIAACAGVSLKTAQLALDRLVRDAVCVRRPKKGTYLRSSTLRPYIALINLHRYSDPRNDLIFSRIYTGISRRADELSIDILMSPDGNISESQISDNEIYDNKDLFLQGIIILPSGTPDAVRTIAERHPYIKAAHVHAYFGNETGMPDNCYGIFNDDLEGGKQLSRTFAPNAQDFFIFEARGPTRNQPLRAEGFIQGLAERKLTVRDNRHWLLTVHNDFSVTCENYSGEVLRIEKTVDTSPFRRFIQIGYRAAQILFTTYRGTDRFFSESAAVFCTQDLIAAGIKKFCAAHSLGGIPVAGFDNIIPHLSAEYGYQTMHVEYEQMGIKAVECVMSGSGEMNTIQRIPPRIIY